MKTFSETLIGSQKFVYLAELVTSRGLLTDQKGSQLLNLARELSETRQIDALSITDNPGGHPMINAEALGLELRSLDQETIIHLSCKDWNRNAIESRGWQLASLGFNNILALSGDYPAGGYQGQASPVFDTDSVGLLRMFSSMNAGFSVGNHTLSSTNFLLGATVNNNKRYERELMPQYFKLAKKITTGARFIISQIGWDSRKQDELLRYMALHDLRVPVIANIYILNHRTARFFASGKIPGVVVHTNLLQLAEKQAASPDKGKAFFLELAAKQLAVARGFGYRGVYLGGLTSPKDFNRVMEITNNYGIDDWRHFTSELYFHFPDEFYYFEPGATPGTNSERVNRQYLESLEKEARLRLQHKVPLSYKLSRQIHNKIFQPDTFGFKTGQKLAQRVEKSGPRTKQLFHTIEQISKYLAYNCQDCGDCSLSEIAYLCPESQCVKNQRNGPCGGTREGKCEVGDKECIWSRAYDRLKPYGEEQFMVNQPVILKNSGLQGTSSWINTFLQRDHFASHKSSKDSELATPSVNSESRKRNNNSDE